MPSKSPEEQQQIVKQFREECIAEGIITANCRPAQDDHILLRFLRARQFNLPASKLMLKNCEDWRQSVGGGRGMEQLYKDIDPFDYPERDVVFKHWPLYFHKTDKKGRPINIHKFGHINANELLKAVSLDRFMDIFTVNCDLLTREILPSCSKAADKRVETVLVIVDLKGFGISQFWSMKDLVRTSFQISQDYYPETMGQVAIINAPMTFTTMWSAIKPWLAKETVEKVDILGSDYQSALLRIADADALPAELGGTCTCADHGGDCATSNVGPWMDGRAERRAAWLRGERADIAVDALEAPGVDGTASDGRAPEPKTSLPTAHAGTAEAPQAPLEAAVERALPADDAPPPTPPQSSAPELAAAVSVPPSSEPEATALPTAERDFARESEGERTPIVPAAAAPFRSPAETAAAAAAAVAPVADDDARTPMPPVSAPARYPVDATPTAEERTPMPPAVVPAGYADAPPRTASPEGLPRSSVSTTPESTDEAHDAPPSSARTSVSEADVRSARSVRSATSRKSTRSTKSGLAGLFGRKGRDPTVRTDEEDSDREGAAAGVAQGGERKSKLKATVGRVMDKVMGEGRMSMR